MGRSGCRAGQVCRVRERVLEPAENPWEACNWGRWSRLGLLPIQRSRSLGLVPGLLAFPLRFDPAHQLLVVQAEGLRVAVAGYSGTSASIRRAQSASSGVTGFRLASSLSLIEFDAHFQAPLRLCQEDELRHVRRTEVRVKPHSPGILPAPT